MNFNERIQLQKMLQENNNEDHTDNIRKLKHSDSIKRDVIQMQILHSQHNELQKNDVKSFNNLCIEKCPFLFNNYTDIFHKLKNKELDVQMFMEFVRILKKIEDGVLDQHEGAYEVGKILKSIYIDSALKKQENQNIKDEENKVVFNDGNTVSWKDFKQQSK